MSFEISYSPPVHILGIGYHRFVVVVRFWHDRLTWDYWQIHWLDYYISLHETLKPHHSKIRYGNNADTNKYGYYKIMFLKISLKFETNTHYQNIYYSVYSERNNFTSCTISIFTFVLLLKFTLSCIMQFSFFLVIP